MPLETLGPTPEKATFRDLPRLVGKAVEFSRIRRNAQDRWETDTNAPKETGVVCVIGGNLYHIQANGYRQTINEDSIDALEIVEQML